MTARVRLRLALAAVLLALGVVWTSTPGTIGYLTPGSTMLTNQYNGYTGDLDLVTQYTPGYYLPGAPGSATPGFQSEVRVGLVPAVLVLAWAVLRPSPRNRRAVRVAVILLAASALWGVGHGLVRGPALALSAALLAASTQRAVDRRRTRRSGGSGGRTTLPRSALPSDRTPPRSRRCPTCTRVLDGGSVASPVWSGRVTWSGSPRPS